MTNPPPPSAAPGWYPDPWGRAPYRWYDGQQWTSHESDGSSAPAQQSTTTSAAAQPAPASPEPERPAPKRRRTGLVVGLSLAGVAVVAIAAVVVSLLVFAPGSPRLHTDVSAQYDYTDDQLDLAHDHEFSFPTSYDVETAGTAPFEVYIDAALTMPADFSVFQFEPGSDVTISGAELPEAVGALSEELDPRINSGRTTGWGTHAEYFLVQRLDRDGDDLAKPIVTRFTIASALEAPTVRFESPGGEGSLRVAWDAVEGADEYIIVASSFDPTNNGLMNVLLGRTSDTTWDSTFEEDTGRPWQFRQNTDLRMFDGSSADELLAGTAEATEQTSGQYAIGVIATDGEAYSGFRMNDLISAAGSLPLEPARNANGAMKKWGPSGYIEGFENVQRRFAFTGLDGVTRTTVAYIDEATAPVDLGDRWALALLGRGTALGEWIPITKSSVTDLAAQIAQFNAEATAAAPQTGLPQFEVASASVAEAGTPVAETPEVDYPVYGSTELTRFLGAHIIAGTARIDVSAWADAPGAPAALDALWEAKYQNPYARDITGVSLVDGGSTLSVSYQSGVMDAESQAALHSAVTDVVAQTVTEGMSDAEKVTALNDWLVAHAEYDYAALAALQQNPSTTPVGFENAFLATGTLLDSVGVCASYAAAFAALANEAGVETVVVAGDVLEGGAHAWNKVRVDGTWLAVDVTWNDSPGGNQFLLIPDSGFTGPATRTEDDRWTIDGTLAAYATP